MRLPRLDTLFLNLLTPLNPAKGSANKQSSAYADKSPCKWGGRGGVHVCVVCAFFCVYCVCGGVGVYVCVWVGVHVSVAHTLLDTEYTQQHSHTQ